MSCKRATTAVLAACALLTAVAGCGAGGAASQGDGGDRSEGASPAPSPVGRVLGDTDSGGRHYREVDEEKAPAVRVEVQPDADGGWDVRLDVARFRFSPAGTGARALPGRGTARLLVDDRPVAELRSAAYRIPAGLLPHGTHQVTARLCADDGTVWAVDGEPVESTADITASQAFAGPTATASPR
ncbi:hypothetical protein ABZ330_14690 [Streptomyces sp. NPDC006172]|uniref:hypothetical protein n=1 Tax=Streptomyces sp. NPDC006172 TaxID=3154470 RepID=UPI0034019056